MPESGGSPSWWDRWFRRQPPARPQNRQSVRSARRNPTPATSASHPVSQLPACQHPAPTAASCPTIVIQQVSSGDSQEHGWSEDVCMPGAGTISGTAYPPPGPSCVQQSGTRASNGGNHNSGPSDTKPEVAGPNNVGSTQSEQAATEVNEVPETDTQSLEPQRALSAMTVDAVSDGCGSVNGVMQCLQSANETTATEGDVEHNSTVLSAEQHFANAEIVKSEIRECSITVKDINDFTYETKENKKISDLTLEGQKLLALWRSALDKKDVLAQLTRECTNATSQSEKRLNKDARNLEELYEELAEALANLQRTTSLHSAVKKDIKAMQKAVSNASANEQAEVGRVAATHEKEAFSKWQSLKGIPTDVEALKSLRRELTEKQRAISGLDCLVRRRLARAESGEADRDTPGQAIRQHNPLSSRRRGGTGRSAGKRKLADGARNERRTSAGGPHMAVRGQGPPTAGANSTFEGGGVAAAAVATQAGLHSEQILGSTLSMSVFTGSVSAGTGPVSATSQLPTSYTASPPAPPPPPPPPPPPQPPATRLLQAPPEDEDSGADETSTSNDEEGAPLGATFPLHLGPALFDGLDPAEAARTTARTMNFH